MTVKITWERNSDGIEGYVGQDEHGQWWGRVDIDAEPIGPHTTKDEAIAAYDTADPRAQELRRLAEVEPPDGWAERLVARFLREYGDGD